MSSQPLGVTYRAVTPEDEYFLFLLFASVRAEELALMAADEQQLELIVNQQFAAKQKHYRERFPESGWRIIEVDGQPVGYVVIDDGETLYLGDIILLPEFRNCGIGTEVCQELMSRDKAVTLMVESFNPAKRLYDRLGFADTEEDSIYVWMRWDPPA